jgi:hypothetical protein
VTNFKRELRATGYAGDTKEFYATVITLFGDTFPGWTDEQLKRNPRRALAFCDSVRQHTGLPELPDTLILGALENGRKQRIRARRFSSN